MPGRLGIFGTRFGTGNRHARASAEASLRQADSARDQRCWLEAATGYRAYLDFEPRAFDIWVQLGHATKEAGDLDGAGRAYQTAMQLRPTDADLLLSLGHLAKIQDELGQAADFYARSLAINGNTDARKELKSGVPSSFLSDAHRELLHANAQADLTRLAERCDGCCPIEIQDLIAFEEGQIALLSSDAWIVFVPQTRLSTAIGLLELSFADNDRSRGAEHFGTIEIDYGHGFRRPEAIALYPVARHALTIALPGQVRQIRWRPDNKEGDLAVSRVALRAVESSAEVERLLPADVAAGDRAQALGVAAQLVASEQAEDPVLASKLLMPGAFDRSFDYMLWTREYLSPSTADYEQMNLLLRKMARRPTFSFVIPTYNSDIELLRACLDSLLGQIYPHFEICIADDKSSNPAVRDVLRDYTDRHDRIKYVERSSNGHIAAASNSALGLAQGEYIVLVDHDDLIPDYALLLVAHYINENPEGRIFFSDEDKITVDGLRFDPYFKGGLNEYLLYGHNMISHLGVYERGLIEEIGGFRIGFEGSQDYDLSLRAIERCGAKAVIHIPHVLYHWRTVPGSTAISADQKDYAAIAARAAINSHFDRTATPLRSVEGFAPGVSAIAATKEYDTPVSVIIPTRDGLDLLKACVDTIDLTQPTNTEIIIIDNASEEAETQAYLRTLSDRDHFRVLPYPAEFNFSLINNFAAEQAAGDILCFLNNDTEIVSPNWLARARALLSMPEIGAVGARLLYPDGTLQHYGIGLGMAEHRVAATPHAGQSGHTPGYFGKARLIQEFSAVTAACLFVRKSVFAEVGGFAPDLRVAYNDVDLCLKIREAGYKILCDPDITLLHKESRTRGSDQSGERAQRLNREARWMRDKWARQLDTDPYLSPNISLNRPDFALAWPPRQPVPWRSSLADNNETRLDD